MDQQPSNSDPELSNPVADFIEAAVWHGSLDRAEAILKAHPWDRQQRH